MPLSDYLSKYKKTFTPDYTADIVIKVSKDGDDAAGSEQGPFLTIERALEELKRIRAVTPERSAAIKISSGE